MSHDLVPIPSRRWRIGVLIALCAFAFIGSTPWSAKAAFAVGTLLMFGTYRRFRLTPASIMERWTVGFVDLPHRSRKWKRYSFLEVVYEARTGIGEFLLFGPLAFLFGWIVDRCFPWIGGTYQVWLNNEADERVLAWQGNSQAMYERNLGLLQSVTGLRIRMR